MGTRSVNAEIMDINRLSDADLYHMLISYGVEIGPVVASTRFLYEKKLQQLIHSDKSDVTYYKPEATLSPQLPSSPPVISEPEVSFNDYPETVSPMRTEVADGGPRPNTAFGFGNGIRSQTKGSTPKTGKSHLQQAQSKDGSRSRIALIIEVAVITFLIVVGYLFYQEMQTLDEAVKNGQTEL